MRCPLPRRTPEFKRDVLEVLRQPLEDGQVSITRVSAALTDPAKSMMIAAMTPTLLDRIDIHTGTGRLKQDEMTHEGLSGESSAALHDRVGAARKVREARFAGTAHIHARQIRSYCKSATR